jgi:glycosyltransferase involved in cell wall biosynthesis
VLWGGGIWNWLDPLTLVRAWPQVAKMHPNARLVFLGTKNPNPIVPVHEMVHRTIALAEEVGEKDGSIVFVEWLSYEDHEAVLCESDLGVTLQPQDVETRFSIRTRVIDYFRMGLPCLVSEGDITSEWIEKYHLGIVVPTADVDATARALNELLDKPRQSWQPGFQTIRQALSWSNVVEPLRQYCLNGKYAPDRVQRTGGAAEFDEPQSTLMHALQTLRRQGPIGFVKRVRHHLLWRAGKV